MGGYNCKKEEGRTGNAERRLAREDVVRCQEALRAVS